MPILPGEPDSAEAIASWITERVRVHDRFRHVYDASERHREQHGPECTVYASGSGPVLGTLVAAAGARRILELGCGLGYSALWLAYGSSPDGRVETIERDPMHAELARKQFVRESFAERITVLEGRGIDLLQALTGPYDLIFCDSDPDEYRMYPDHFLRLLKPGGLLITSNLFLGRYSLDIPGLDQAAAYREWLLAEERLLTAFQQGGMALSVRRKQG
jgi:predicted O-methyltransferase YrrM